MYTMTDAREQDDASVRPYGKSLLYLVSRGFEETVPTPLVGMEASVKRDLDAIRFFGLAGTQKVADVVFSTTMASAPPDARSQSITHGGFDNDVATMTSVVRRVLGVPTGPVVEYFEDAVPGFSKAAVGIPPEGIRAAAAGTRAAAGAARSAAFRAARKPWTVMVWMAGDNDLEDFGDTDLGELKRVGSNARERGGAVRQHARRSHATLLPHEGVGARNGTPLRNWARPIPATPPSPSTSSDGPSNGTLPTVCSR